MVGRREAGLLVAAAASDSLELLAWGKRRSAADWGSRMEEERRREAAGEEAEDALLGRGDVAPGKSAGMRRDARGRDETGGKKSRGSESEGWGARDGGSLSS